MTDGPFARWASDVEVLIDHQTVYVYGAELGDDSGPVEERATERVWSSSEHVGGCSGLTAIRVPRQTYADARVHVQCWEGKPAGDEADWDFVAEFDLPVRGGALYLYGGGTEPATVECQDGYFRARFSARGYAVAESMATDEEFRLQLWAHDGAVHVVKQWHGWAV